MKSLLKLGTRASPLALYQAEVVKASLIKVCSQLQVEIVKISTSGDMTRRRKANPLDTKRIFTREIEEALINGEIDFAAHSAKDMSVTQPEGLALGGAMHREDSRDCFISRDYKSINDMPIGARLGTASLRRKLQALRLHPDLLVEEVHGNVQTRMRKMDDGHYDAIILAFAGMKRLGLTNHVSQVFSRKEFHPAPGQGIIVCQFRASDTDTRDLMRAVNNKEAWTQLLCEQAFLRELEGGCQLPCGMDSRIEGDQIFTEGILLSPDERKWVEAKFDGALSEPEAVGRGLALKIKEEGGAEILKDIKEHYRAS